MDPVIAVLEGAFYMDNKLKCDAVNCVHNFNHLCAAEEIQIQGAHTMGGRFTYCDTFHSRSLGNYVSSLTNTNFNGVLNQFFTDEQVMAPKVLCNAVNCIYNSSNECEADNLQIVSEISTTAEQTECQTFYPR